MFQFAIQTLSVKKKKKIDHPVSIMFRFEDLNVVLSFVFGEWLSCGSSSIEMIMRRIIFASWNHRPEITSANSLADSAGSRLVITVYERGMGGFNRDSDLKRRIEAPTEFKIQYQLSLYIYQATIDWLAELISTIARYSYRDTSCFLRHELKGNRLVARK